MKTIHLLILLMVSSVASATSNLKYTDMKSLGDVFSINGTGNAGFMISAISFKDWKEKQSGANFPLNVSPVFSGIVSGGVAMPPPVTLNPAQFSGQEKDFAEFVNDKNQGAKRTPPLALKPGETNQSKLANDEAGTYVVQTVISSVIERPLNEMNLGPEKLLTLAKEIDKAHFHYTIPGTTALSALDQDHIAGRGFDTKKTYLLSAIDFRKYDCEELKIAVDTYFKNNKEKRPLWRSSIYMISDLNWNDQKDLQAAEALFHRRPSAILVQHVIYADHLAKAAENIFVFFAEGNKTRAVFVSNLALQSSYFTGKMSKLYHGYIFDGLDKSWLHTGANAVIGAKQGLDSATEAIGSMVGLGSKKQDKSNDGLGDLLEGANEEMKKDNKCDRGLAIGLPRYSQSLFSSFAGYLNSVK